MLQGALAQVVLHPIDAEKGAGPQLAEKHRVRGYPTFVLVDATGEEIDRLVGYGGPEPFAAALSASLTDPVTVAQRQARLAANPTAADAEKLGRIMSGRGDPQAAVPYFRQASRLDPSVDLDYPAFEALAMGMRRGLATPEQLREAADAVFARPDRDPEQLLMTAYTMNSYARRTDSPGLRSPYVVEAIARTEQVADPGLAGLRGELLISRALHIDRDRPRALELKRASLPQGWRDDAGRLNQFAWWCFENRVNLVEAEALALRSAELAGDDAERAEALDTVAEIRLARGNARGALSAAREAAAADPDRQQYRAQVERFTLERRRADPSR